MNEKAQTTEAAKVEKPEFLLTKSGVMIVGSELIGEKLTAIICEVLAAKDIFGSTGLCVLVLRDDGYPIDVDETPVFGMAFADAYSVSINLQRCWDNSMTVAGAGEKNISFLGALWINVLTAIGHEMDHLALAYDDRDLYETMRRDEEGCEELEKTAHTSSVQMIIEMAKRFDIEMPAISEMGCFAAKWMKLHTNDDTKSLEWVVKARKMAGEGVIYEEKENDIIVNSFREYVKLAYEPESEDDSWEQPTTPVNLIVHLDNGATEEIKAEPVVEPKVEVMTPDEAPVETVELPAGGGVMQMAAAMGGDQFITGADIADEDAAAEEAMHQAEYDANAGADAADAAAASVQTTTVTLPEPTAVPLPTAIAQQQAYVAASAATARPPVQPMATTYTPNNLTPEVMAQTMRAVYLSLNAHLFTKCGWQQNPQTGRFFFANPGAVLEGVNIQHILTLMGADNFIIEYDTLNAAGQFAAENCQGMIRGYLTTKQGLPAYSIYLNVGGRRIKRSFLPQNPDKRNAQNAYTKSADEAGQGHVIAWVFKDEAADNAPFKEKCAVKIYDNIYEAF